MNKYVSKAMRNGRCMRRLTSYNIREARRMGERLKIDYPYAQIVIVGPTKIKHRRLNQ